MPRQIFDYDPPERFVAGTVGQPGERTFYLQARGSGRITSVALEKQQVGVLAERVGELLDEVLRRSGGTAPVPAVAPDSVEDLGPLDQPLVEEFRVGTMALSWDGETEQVVIEAQAVSEDDDADAPVDDDAGDDAGDDSADDSGGGPLLRVHITGAMARAFAKRALSLVAAGRPPCPFCGLPLDAEGHICPRQNGYRR